MLSCINKSSVEYQSLKDRAGIPDFILEAVCRDFMDKYGRFPYLDELPNSNSEPYLREKLHINQYNGAKISTLLDEAGVENIEQVAPALNDIYRDVEVQVTPLVEEAIVDIEHRPTNNNFDEHTIKSDEEVNSVLVLDQALEKLANVYGIKFHAVTDSELNSEEWSNIPDVKSVKAFIYNGEIYINIDKNSVDAPLHEMMHMLVGSTRFQNPQLYQSLVESVQGLPNYEALTKNYPGRTRNDVNEEIFVSELSKHLTGQGSALGNLDDKTKYEILYSFRRLLDSVLMGSDSVSTISKDRLFNMSMKQIADEVNSSIMQNKFHGTVNVDGASLHRTLNNIKSELYEKKELEEYCN